MKAGDALKFRINDHTMRVIALTWDPLARAGYEV